MTDRSARQALARRVAGEVTLSSDPGKTLRKWRTEFDVTQTELADELEISSSVISDYESGRRANPGIGIVRRLVSGLLTIDERRGGTRIHQYARVMAAGFDSDIVLDLKEYPHAMSLSDFYAAIGAEEATRGAHDSITGHTVIDSIEAIKRLTHEEFYRLYGQSTNRALIFTAVTRGESPLVAMRVANPTPEAVVLHGIETDDLWEHATDLARMDGVSLATTSIDVEAMLEALQDLP